MNDGKWAGENFQRGVTSRDTFEEARLNRRAAAVREWIAAAAGQSPSAVSPATLWPSRADL